MSVEHKPSLVLADAILDHVETFLAESGCPLTVDQRAAFHGARKSIGEQAAS